MEETHSLSMNQWSAADKPREKMLEHGKKYLTNTELIAILLRSGLQGKSVMKMAQEILSHADNSLTRLAQMDYSELSAMKGMGEAKATTLMAALELGWRMQGEMSGTKETIINDSRALFDYMIEKTADLAHEEFWAIYLNRRNKVLGRQCIARGGQTDTTVDMRILFRGALENKAVGLMVCHNHPSGNLRPSPADKRLTENILNAGKLLEIKLLDHIIVGIKAGGQAGYFSFHDEGLL